jgi:methylated-DNA-[protein]-cysteine S-methyltransferase
MAVTTNGAATAATAEGMAETSRRTRVVELDVAECDCPAGAVTVAVHDGRVCALVFSDRWPGMERWLARRFGAEIRLRQTKDPARVISRLRDYFAGHFAVLDDIDVDTGGTPFQQSVWRALRDIPAGKTMSYGELARIVGTPTASRAVGAANGANPVSIIIPCHRVIGSNGTLTGYGGGMPRKRWLLSHEGVMVGLPLD